MRIAAAWAGRRNCEVVSRVPCRMWDQGELRGRRARVLRAGPPASRERSVHRTARSARVYRAWSLRLRSCVRLFLLCQPDFMHQRIQAVRICSSRARFYPAADIDAERLGLANCSGNILRSQAAGDDDGAVFLCFLRDAPIKCLARAAAALGVEGIEQKCSGAAIALQSFAAESGPHTKTFDDWKRFAQFLHVRRGFFAVQLNQVQVNISGGAQNIIE